MSPPKRNQVIGARCRPREASVIRVAAELEGVTVSEFVRDRVLAEARDVVSRTTDTEDAARARE